MIDYLMAALIVSLAMMAGGIGYALITGARILAGGLTAIAENIRRVSQKLDAIERHMGPTDVDRWVGRG